MKKLLTLVLLTLGLSVSAMAGEQTPTYKIGAHVNVDTAKAKLAEAGFEVVATYPSFDKGTTILYTNAAMKADAAKPMRGFSAVGRILVDDERQQISIANPVYFGAAFMQKEYNAGLATTTLASLEKAFGPFKNSEDSYEFEDLAGYHFMISRPYYEDMVVLGEGSTADLLAKAKASKNFITSLELGADSHVVYLAMDNRTSGFVKKIGTQNSQLLPWAVLIEGGKAKALRADYFIAISYPLLDLMGFAGIMTTPDAVIKSLQSNFK